MSTADQEINGAGPDSPRFTLLKAEVLLFRRDANAALTLLEPSRPGAAFPPELVPRQQYLLGHARIVQGRLAEALAVLGDAERRAEERAQHDVALDALLLRGQALLRSGRSDEGEQVLATGLQLAEEAKDSYRAAVALHNLGYRRVIANRYDEALPYFERLLASKELEGYTVYATALTNSAVCEMKLGNFDRAVATLQRAVGIHERTGATAYLEQAVGELGAAYGQKQDYRQAAVHLQRALTLAKDVGAHVDAARWAVNLATTYIQLRQWDDAERLTNEAKALGGDRRNAPYLLLNVARVAVGRGSSEDAEAAYVEARAAGLDDAAIQWMASAELGRMYAAEGRAQMAAAQFETALDVIEQNQAGLLKPEDRLSILPRLVSFYGSYIDFLVSRREFDRALEVADSSRARVLAERTGANAPRRLSSAVLRRAAARVEAALLFYWLGPEKSYAWLVTAEGSRFVPLPATADAVEALVRRHQQFIVESVGDVLAVPSTPGDELYASLVAPVADVLPRAGRVVIVPDGALTRLNFDTLPVDGERRHYLIEDVEIAVTPSLATLIGGRDAPDEDERQLLLIGDAVQADPQYPALRYASTEMTAVANAFDGRAAVYSGADATPARYREAMSERFDVVHFTAHAAANAESPLDSAVILSPGASGYKLYARDVAELPLAADLVTISACRSAGDRSYAGEGLVGFAWAFLRAGSRRVIAGLWDVDDRSTADLMGDFYERLATGESAGASLRAAKLAMIARGGALAKPYYWGPFQLFAGSTAIP